MLILILIDIQYLQNIGFSFGKKLNVQNHLSDFHHLIKNFPLPHNAGSKTLLHR